MLLLVREEGAGEGRGRGGVLLSSVIAILLPTHAVFDETGHFVIYSTLFGIKGGLLQHGRLGAGSTVPTPSPILPLLPFAVVNIVTNKCVDMIGKDDSVRFLAVSLFQGKPSKSSAASTLVGKEKRVVS